MTSLEISYFLIPHNVIAYTMSYLEVSCLLHHLA